MAIQPKPTTPQPRPATPNPTPKDMETVAQGETSLRVNHHPGTPTPAEQQPVVEIAEVNPDLDRLKGSNEALSLALGNLLAHASSPTLRSMATGWEEAAEFVQSIQEAVQTLRQHGPHALQPTLRIADVIRGLDGCGPDAPVAVLNAAGEACPVYDVQQGSTIFQSWTGFDQDGFLVLGTPMDTHPGYTAPELIQALRTRLPAEAEVFATSPLFDAMPIREVAPGSHLFREDEERDHLACVVLHGSKV